MVKSNLGLIGISVMGSNLALNFERNGYRLSVYDIDENLRNKFRKKSKTINVLNNLKEFVESLESPKIIMLMIKAGEPVSQVIESLLPYLSKKDIIIDGGNSNFKDTIKRTDYLLEKGIEFVGAGISGGAKGALLGPSIMPSGSDYSKEKTSKIFMDISAKAKDKKPCSQWIGGSGSGHFVKMVHNGIEYADMEIISETYNYLKHFGYSNNEIAEVFEKFKNGILSSFLIEITAKILRTKDDETDAFLIDLILDEAGQKGTGKWTAINALDLDVSVPSIYSALFLRSFSSKRKEIKIPREDKFIKKQVDLVDLESAVYFAKICAYAEGIDLLNSASKEYDWNLNIGEITLIWREGCIIRAEFLNKISQGYRINKNARNLLEIDYFYNEITKGLNSIKSVIKNAMEVDIPFCSFHSALNYFNALKAEKLPVNIIQAQRDYFGAHTYSRTDKLGSFTTLWETKLKL